MIGNRYLFKSKSGLGWAVVGADKLKLTKKGWMGLEISEIDYSEVDDPGGALKLSDENRMLDFVALRASDPDLISVNDIQRHQLKAGEYFPRIWRGYEGENIFIDTFDKLDARKIYGREYTSSIVAAESLLIEVEEMFRFVEPDVENDGVYGHRFRELLILLCTEIEACWAGIYKANFPCDCPVRLTTNQYVKIKDVMFLGDYRLSLKDYPHRPFAPFAGWDPTSPTASLAWFDAYNKVKHDRAGNFPISTMQNVLTAAAAIHVLQVAQWGVGVFDRWRGNRKSIFSIDEIPEFPLSQIYLPKDGTENEFDLATPYELALHRL